ncbi:MAG: toprim domain-containing protein, partial [Chloroflexota bacterium]
YAEDDIIAAGLALRSERTGKLYDRFRNRFMVPIRDQRGRTVGFGGRILDPDDKPKYMNSPQTPVFDKSKLLFGLDLAKDTIRDGETAVIVEGYMDAITAYQAGFTNVVAQMGTAMTDTQLGLIAPKWAKRIVLALDSDAAGQNATLRSLEVARDALKADYSGRMKIDMRVLQIPDAKDPDDLIRENPQGWQTLVDNAMTVADFLINMEVAQLPANPTVQDREAVARRVMPLLLATENNLYQKDNVQKLAMRLLLPESDLMRLATEQVKINQAKPPKRIKPPVLDDDGDMPPPRTDFDDAPPPADEDNDGPPPRDYGEDVQPGQAKPAARRAPLTNDAKVEAHLLHGLIHHPDVYYRVNGKLHEVLLTDETLAPALAAFGADDFSRTELRELMALYLQALEQDDMDIRAYILTYTDDALTAELEMVLEDRMQAIMHDEKRVARGDLERVLEKIQRTGVIVDPRSDLIARALRLRCRRLMREREELRLVQMNALTDSDYDTSDACASQIDILARAMHLLEIEEKQVASLYQ